MRRKIVPSPDNLIENLLCVCSQFLWEVKIWNIKIDLKYGFHQKL